MAAEIPRCDNCDAYATVVGSLNGGPQRHYCNACLAPHLQPTGQTVLSGVYSMGKKQQRDDRPEWLKWLAACEADPETPANLPGSIEMLTGQDKRALGAIAACWELYFCSDDTGRAAALEAVTVLLPGMQAKCLLFARELIAFAGNWSDRERLWSAVAAILAARTASR